MRYQYIKLTGYIGIYNGLGLEEIAIDLSKSRNNIILICGANGSGKSTLLKAISLFPDPSSSYIPGREARKQLVISDRENLYEINIISPIDPKGERKVTKISIKKNGLELNPNGNVNSYKDIIFTEFELDSNFNTLTMLTSVKRGLGDCTPAERKLYVSRIIENLEVYNEMYKTLNKKSSIFKSHVNTLHTKIQNIGNRENLESRLRILNRDAGSINNEIMSLNNSIVSIQAKNGDNLEDAKKLQELYSKRDNLQPIYDSDKASLDSFINKTKISVDSIEEDYKSDSEILAKYNVELEKSKYAWMSLSNKLNSQSEIINSVQAQIDSYADLDNSSELLKQYDTSKSIITQLERELIENNIRKDLDVSYIQDTIDLLSTICKYIDGLYADISIKDVEYVVRRFSPELKDEHSTSLLTLKERLSELDAEIRILEEQEQKVAILNNRPVSCKIDSCSFIAEALELKAKNINYKKEKQQLEQKKNNCQDSINTLIATIEYENSLISKHNIFRDLMSTIKNNKDKFGEFGISYLVNDNIFIDMLASLNRFDYLHNPTNLVNGLNALRQYKSQLSIHTTLEAEVKAYNDKTAILNTQKELLVKLTGEYEDTNKQVISLKNDYDKYIGLVSSFSFKVSTEKEYLDQYNKFKNTADEYSKILEEIDELKAESSKAVAELSKIDGYRAQIYELTNNRLNPIQHDISLLNGQLTLLNSYQVEYNEYKSKYDMIETLKKYCSPTGGGIQVLFMQLYMSKTLELSNQILSLLFNGEYRLLDFIINQNEFRIPFLGSGLTVDDISSGSNSQICMMSTIINLVLVYQASTKYNICCLDEIDGGLDYFNRTQFVQVIYKIIEILQFEQVFMISHSSELDAAGNLDIIKLRDDVNYNDIYKGNVLYDYNQK